jgi:hypothetical protein
MSTEENPHTGQGPVMLDIGGDVGALVLAMPAALEGVEIEIRPLGRPVEHSDTEHLHHLGDGGHEHSEGAQRLTHVAVVGRPVGETVFHCAVFPELLEGSYELYERPACPVRLAIAVKGGQVTQAVWPASSEVGSPP